MRQFAQPGDRGQGVGVGRDGGGDVGRALLGQLGVLGRVTGSVVETADDELAGRVQRTDLPAEGPDAIVREIELEAKLAEDWTNMDTLTEYRTSRDELQELLALRGIGGVGSAMFTVSAMALLLRVAGPEQRGRAASAFQAGFLFGGITGPAIGGLVVVFSIRAPFFVYAFTLGLATIVAVVFLRSPEQIEAQRLAESSTALNANAHADDEVPDLEPIPAQVVRDAAERTEDIGDDRLRVQRLGEAVDDMRTLSVEAFLDKYGG